MLMARLAYLGVWDFMARFAAVDVFRPMARYQILGDLSGLAR